MSHEMKLMAAPAATYRLLAAQDGSAGLRVLLRRPLFVCLVLGVAVTLGATGRVSAGGVLSSALVWSHALLVQMAALAATMAVARHVLHAAAVPFARATDLFFMGHLPWSLWLLGLAGAAAVEFPEGVARWPSAVQTAVIASGLVPIVLTFRITLAFGREVLALPRRAAWLAAAFYAALIYAYTIAHAGWATALWSRSLTE
jgi:hypothetical protein